MNTQPPADDTASAPVRVLQILTCDALGGTELMLAALLERLDRSQVQATLVTLDRPGPIAERMCLAGLPVRSLGNRGIGLAFARLAGMLRREKFDVVNAYGFKSTTVTRLLVALVQPSAAFVNGVRGLHLTETAGVDSPKARCALVVERLGSRFVDAYDANSHGALELLAAAGIDRSQMHYIPNGIDLSSWPPTERDPTRVEPVIACVARFVSRKRHADLLRASTQLHERGLRHRLVFAGHGPTHEQEKTRARDLGIEPWVSFLGRADGREVRRALADADVFCLVSTWEGMAGTVMEAMASGLPVVGSDVNGIRDLVRDGVTGLLVPPCDPEALSEALATLLADPIRRQAMGRRGREHVAQEFSMSAMVDAKQQLFIDLGAPL